ncbi:hypothetical protein EJB05_27751, partial [Eragrostis curvula]
MAIKSLHVLVPVTLCFLLVVAAQGKELNVTVVVQGQAKCKNNTSAVMSHATLHLMINGTTVPGAGTTTSNGEILMAVNLTTRCYPAPNDQWNHSPRSRHHDEQWRDLDGGEPNDHNAAAFVHD